MGKLFSLIIGLLLLGFGLANFFVPPLRLPGTQAVVHIVLGLAGVIAAFRYSGKGFLRLFAGFALVLAALGFLGISSLFDLFILPLYLYWSYFILGLLAIWVYLTVAQADRLREVRDRERENQQT